MWINAISLHKNSNKNSRIRISIYCEEYMNKYSKMFSNFSIINGMIAQFCLKWKNYKINLQQNATKYNDQLQNFVNIFHKKQIYTFFYKHCMAFDLIKSILWTLCPWINSITCWNFFEWVFKNAKRLLGNEVQIQKNPNKWTR